MDHATADLILSLQFEDLMSLNQTDHLATASSASTDAEAALDLYRNELRNNALLLSDRHLSTRYGEADATEDQPPSSIESPTPTFDHLLTRYEEDRIQSCIACGDGHAIRNLITVPCGHCYCKPCIGGIGGVDETEGLFELAMKDESLFPPRCCKEAIPVEVANRFLNESQIRPFEEKTVEYATMDKTYCHNTQCGKFILPTNIEGEKADCQHCGLMTCSVCKAVAHDGDCPIDPAYVSLMELAEAEGWKKCSQCKRLVELSFGCNHMT